MHIKWKIIAPFAILAFLLLTVAGMRDKEALPDPLVGGDAKEAPTSVSATQVTATGDVDDLVTSLGGEADGDAAILVDSDVDTAIVLSDSESVTSLGTSYDETQF